MNNENNENNLNQPIEPTVGAAPVAETPVAEPTVEAAPVAETPVVEPTVEAAPVAETPVVEPTVEAAPVAETPVVEPTVEAAPVAETPVVEPTVEAAPVVETPVVEPTAAQPATTEAPAAEPTVEAAPVAETPAVEATPTAAQPATTEAPAAEPKKSKLPLILIIVGVLVCAGVCVFFLLNKKPATETNNNNNSNNNTNTETNVSSKAKDFLFLSLKYADEVDRLWKNDEIVCQDAANQQELLKPSELSDTDSYSGPAYYYVFIDTEDDKEIKLDVGDNTPVSGWVRIGKQDNSYYIALSDGTNYIVDTGTDFGTKTSELTVNDVVTTGNGSNYQYKNGEVFGSNTEGKGWGIGDYKVSTDGDESNDGIYMSNGSKTSGWTPFCSLPE